MSPSPRRTCEADLLVAEQAEDAVVQLHVPAVALLHLPQDAHQLRARLGGMRALALVRRKLVEGALPGAANPLVLALSHPGNTTTSVNDTVLQEEEWRRGGEEEEGRRGGECWRVANTVPFLVSICINVFFITS